MYDILTFRGLHQAKSKCKLKRAGNTSSKQNTFQRMEMSCMLTKEVQELRQTVYSS